MRTTTDTTAVCTRCKVEKPLSDFHVQPDKRNGRHSGCKPCVMERARELYAIKTANTRRNKPPVDLDAKRDAARAQNRAWYANNRDRAMANQRRNALRRIYGLTEEQYASMLAVQGGKCALCGGCASRSKAGRLQFRVDHCHKTGVVRGLLCAGCNTGLALLGDTPDSLRKALIYVSVTETQAQYKGAS